MKYFNMSTLNVIHKLRKVEKRGIYLKNEFLITFKTRKDERRKAKINQQQ